MSIHGFELLREERVAEIDADAQLYRHLKTGAELLSLRAADANKWFGITFRTLPADSTGVAHILEHCVLCGSEKYPLKDTFAEVLKGSLQTFLNAMTYADKTVYPVASQNLQDFRNLVDVYLNAVLHPLLRRETFLQQAWHYELAEADQSLAYKGVVFNEMKGAFAVPDSQLWRFTRSALFPDTVYGVESGGDPRHIPDLTYAQLVDFHRTYYHPSNARIFFYGDDDPTERLRTLDQYLSAFEPSPPRAAVALQPRFAEPRRIERTYAGPDGADAKAMLTVNWVLGEQTDQQRVLALRVLAQLLIGTPAAPLRRALIESGLGEDLAGVGLAESLRQGYFAVGLKGIRPERAADVETLVLATLEQLAAEGLEPEQVAAALNTVEFRLRENNPGDGTRGLSILLRALSTWLHDGDPLAPLQWSAPFAALRAAVAAEPNFFGTLIRDTLLANSHRLTVLLRPDAELNQQQNAAEQARLTEARSALDDAELAEIAATTAELRRLQSTPDAPEAVATLPTLRLADLDRTHRPIPSEVVAHGPATLLAHALNTNGIVYIDVALDLGQVPAELVPYARVFGRALIESGTREHDYVTIASRIGRDTGGIRAETLVDTVRDTDQPTARLVLRGKALAAQTAELTALLGELLVEPRLDNRERLREIVLEEKAGLEASLVPAGHQFTSTRLRAHFSRAGWAAEQIGGVEQLLFLRRLADAIEEDWPAVHAALTRLHSVLVRRRGLVCNVTVDRERWPEIRRVVEKLCDRLPDGDAAAGAPWPPTLGAGDEAFTLPAQVNYVGRGARLFELGYRLDGSVNTILRYVNSGWLWDQVRVQGGAYGGFATLNPRSGVWTFTSYRDPNIASTLDVYARTAEHLRSAELGEHGLTRSIVGALGALEPYRLPDAQGWVALQRFLTGETDARLQQQRDEVLGTTLEDVRAFGDVLERVTAQGRVVVLGGAPAIAAAVDEGLTIEVRNLL